MPTRVRPPGTTWHQWKHATDPDFRNRVRKTANAWRKKNKTAVRVINQRFTEKQQRHRFIKSTAKALDLHWNTSTTWEEAGAAVMIGSSVKSPVFFVIGANGKRRRECLGLLEQELAEWSSHTSWESVEAVKRA